MNEKDLEMFRGLAALGNPVAQHMVDVADGVVRVGRKKDLLPENHEWKYLPPVDPVAEAELLQEQKESSSPSSEAGAASTTAPALTTTQEEYRERIRKATEQFYGEKK